MRDSFFEKYKTSEVANTRRVIEYARPFYKNQLLLYSGGRIPQKLKAPFKRRSGLKSYLFLIVLSEAVRVSYRDKAETLLTVPAYPGDCFFLDCKEEYHAYQQ